LLDETRRSHDAAREVIDGHGHPPAERPTLREREGAPSGPEAGHNRGDGQIDVPDVIGPFCGDDARRESGVEETYSEQVALAQRTEDRALADAEWQDVLNETAADNAQRQSDASANAAFLSAQYAAKVAAMQTLAVDLNNAPWAQYQVARAAAEEAAWDGTGPSPLAPNSSPLAQQYLAWQQQVSDAYTTYAGARAGPYFTSATDIAAQSYTDATYSANRTVEEVAALSGDELAFEQHLADRVFSYREDMAAADQVYADALADDARSGITSDDDAHNNWLGVTDDTNGSAATTYQAAYVQLDGQRRHDVASEGLKAAA
jgi:hypothetical protein